MEFVQQLQDPIASRPANIFGKDNLRQISEGKPTAQFTTYEPVGLSQPGKHVPLFFFRTHGRHEHACYPQIAGQLHVGYGHRLHPRVFDLPHEDIGHFHADLIGHTIGPMISRLGHPALHPGMPPSQQFYS